MAATSGTEVGTPRSETTDAGFHLSWSAVQYAGGVLIGAAVLLSLATVLAGSIFTAPAPGPCFPPGGGSPIACPATELTPNNLFTLLALVILSLFSFTLGVVLLVLSRSRRSRDA